MLAAAFLVSICVHQSRPLPVPSPTPVAAPAPGVIALTTSEVRHLLARLIWPAPTSAALICQWSWWRRTHQYWAGYYHRRRRQKAGEALRSAASVVAWPSMRPLLLFPGTFLGKTPRKTPGNLPATTTVLLKLNNMRSCKRKKLQDVLLSCVTFCRYETQPRT